MKFKKHLVLFIWELKSYLKVKKAIPILLTLVLFDLLLLSRFLDLSLFLEKGLTRSGLIAFAYGDLLYVFLYFIVPVIASMSVAEDIDRGMTRTYLTLPITRKSYFIVKIISDLLVMLVCINLPLWSAYLFLGVFRNIWFDVRVLRFSISLFLCLTVLYFVSLLWAVIQPYGTGSALSAIITLNLWYFLPAFLSTFFPKTTYAHIFLYSFTPNALLDYFFDFLYMFPFNNIVSQIWLENYYWVVRNTLTTSICVGLFSLVAAYVLFSRKDL